MASQGEQDPTQQPTPAQQHVKHPKIPLFYGLPNGKDEIKARDLVARIEAHCAATGRNTQCSELYLVLRGNAVAWYDSLAIMGVDVLNWDALKGVFLRDYEFKIAGNMPYKLDSLQQKTGENVIDFFARVNLTIDDFCKDCPHAGNQIATDVRKFFQKGLFVSGLRNDIKTETLKREPIGELMEARQYAQKMEFIANTKGRQEYTAPITAVDELERQVDALETEENDGEAIQEEEVALLNRLRARNGRRPIGRGGFRMAGRGGGTGSSAKFTGTCYNCGTAGHKSSQCRQPKKNNVRAIDERNDEQENNSQMASLKPIPLNW